MNKIVGFVAVLTVVALIGCADSVNGGAGTFNIEEGGGNGSEVEIGVEFRLENETEIPIYVQKAMYPSPGWLSVTRDGEELTIQEDICVLPRRCGEEGAVDCGMMPPYLEELEAGDNIGTGWEGSEYVVGEDDDGQCYEEEMVDPGETLKAEFCYGFDDRAMPPEGELTDPHCETVEFPPGSTDEVVVTVEDHSPQPSEVSIDFVIENDSDETIYLQRAMFPAPPWLTVTRDGEEVRIMWDCGMPCPCDDSIGCAVCGMPAPYVEALEPGEEDRQVWDGIEYEIVESSDGSICFREAPVTDGVLDAEFCYGRDYVEDEYQELIDDEVCETRSFQLTDDEVVVTAR